MNRFNQSPIELLKTSLQLEFEHFAKYDWSDDILKAKKRQLELIRNIYPVTHTIVKARTSDKPVLKWVDGKPVWPYKLTTPSIND